MLPEPMSTQTSMKRSQSLSSPSPKFGSSSSCSNYSSNHASIRDGYKNATNTEVSPQKKSRKGGLNSPGCWYPPSSPVTSVISSTEIKGLHAGTSGNTTREGLRSSSVWRKGSVHFLSGLAEHWSTRKETPLITESSARTTPIIRRFKVFRQKLISPKRNSKTPFKAKLKTGGGRGKAKELVKQKALLLEEEFKETPSRKVKGAEQNANLHLAEGDNAEGEDTSSKVTGSGNRTGRKFKAKELVKQKALLLEEEFKETPSRKVKGAEQNANLHVAEGDNAEGEDTSSKVTGSGNRTGRKFKAICKVITAEEQVPRNGKDTMATRIVKTSKDGKTTKVMGNRTSGKFKATGKVTTEEGQVDGDTQATSKVKAIGKINVTTTEGQDHQARKTTKGKQVTKTAAVKGKAEGRSPEVCDTYQQKSTSEVRGREGSEEWVDIENTPPQKIKVRKVKKK